jgi:hypothetical protein
LRRVLPASVAASRNFGITSRRFTRNSSLSIAIQKKKGGTIWHSE